MARTRSRSDEITASLATREDPRSELNRRHPPPSVLVIAVPAVRAGAAGPTALARRAKLKPARLTGLLDLPGGLPGKDVFRRVLMTRKPAAWEAGFNAWIARRRDQATAQPGVARPIVAREGKSARRSHDAARDLGALPGGTARAGEFGLAPGQEGCAEQSDEIAAIPALLKKIDARGGVVTSAARGTRKAIAAAVVAAGADYVLAWTSDQGSLHRAVVAHIDEPPEGDLAAAREPGTTGRGPGREETRVYLQVAASEDRPGRGAGEGLKAGGVVPSRGPRDGTGRIDVRSSLSRPAVAVDLCARAVRGHWTVEASGHWSLEVTFREDDSRIRQRVLGSNIPGLYRFRLWLLKRHPDPRPSLAMKRRGCGRRDAFLMEVIGALTC